MRRVVITGMGVVSSIGGDVEEVAASLKAGRSGIVAAPEYADLGFRCQVHGKPTVDPNDVLERRDKRFMGPGAIWNAVAMDEALADSGLEPGEISDERVGMVMGSGGPSTAQIVAAADLTRDKGPKRIGPLAVPKAMSSTASATLAVRHKIKGLSYSISSACTTSLHCAGNAAELIQWGKQDVVFAGGSEELDWTLSNLFDAMGAMSSGYNDTPEKASRPFDKDRDGFVIAGGAGVVVLEEYERAKARGAKIYAEVVGYGATSDGHDMVAPSGEGAERCMRIALKEAGDRKIDYINPHATSTPVGDAAECGAIKNIFGEGKGPFISGTKSMTGHSLGAAGAQELIYSLIMMRDGFVAPSINIDSMDEAAEGLNVVTGKKDVELETILSNSFGFGGTNGTLIATKVD